MTAESVKPEQPQQPAKGEPVKPEGNEIKTTGGEPGTSLERLKDHQPERTPQGGLGVKETRQQPGLHGIFVRREQVSATASDGISEPEQAPQAAPSDATVDTSAHTSEPTGIPAMRKAPHDKIVIAQGDNEQSKRAPSEVVKRDEEQQPENPQESGDAITKETKTRTPRVTDAAQPEKGEVSKKTHAKEDTGTETDLKPHPEVKPEKGNNTSDKETDDLKGAKQFKERDDVENYQRPTEENPATEKKPIAVIGENGAKIDEQNPEATETPRSQAPRPVFNIVTEEQAPPTEPRVVFIPNSDMPESPQTEKPSPSESQATREPQGASTPRPGYVRYTVSNSTDLSPTVSAADSLRTPRPESHTSRSAHFSSPQRETTFGKAMLKRGLTEMIIQLLRLPTIPGNLLTLKIKEVRDLGNGKLQVVIKNRGRLRTVTITAKDATTLRSRLKLLKQDS